MCKGSKKCKISFFFESNMQIKHTNLKICRLRINRPIVLFPFLFTSALKSETNYLPFYCCCCSMLCLFICALEVFFFSTWLPVIYACFYLFTSHFVFVSTLLLTIFSHFSALSADFYYFYTFQVAMHMIPLSLTGATNLRGGFKDDFRDDIRDEN